MDENEKREDLTPDEVEEVEREDVTGEEAHREGEFDYTRRMLDEIHEQLLGVRELIGEVKGAMAMFAEMGATIREDEDREEEVEEDFNPLMDPLGELDLDLD